MSGLLVLAPLWIEGAALRGAGRVIVTGMGSEHARVAAARALAIDVDAVAIAGVGGGVAPGLRAGDLVCATEVRSAVSYVPVPDGAALAAALRGRGARAVAGPIASADRVLGPAERRGLADEGVLAVDMESVWLAAGAGGRPLAVVRVVADADGRRLADPRMLVEGARALLALRRASGALAEWAAASPQLDVPAEEAAA